VFTSAARQPGISEWMHALQREADRQGDASPGVPLERALELLSADAGTQRGGRLDTTPGSRQAVRAWLTAEALTRRDDWPYDDPLRFEFFYPVEQQP
jgi:hypothetical protein